MKDFKAYTDTQLIAKEFEMQHGQVTRAMENLILKFDEILKDDLYAPLILSFNYIKVEKEYRGQKFTVYTMNKNMAILLISRFSSPKTTKYMLGVIYGNALLDSELMNISDTCTDYESMGKALLMLTRINGLEPREQQERMYVNYIVKNFGKFFPKYTLSEREYKLPDGDRIDLVAHDKDGRVVLIEAKINKSQYHKQLRSYSFYFENPILVGVSPVEHKHVDGIINVEIPMQDTIPQLEVKP